MKSIRCSALSALIALVFLSGCYTVPETGRRSFNILSPKEEIAMGASSFGKIKTQEKISTNTELNSVVQRVGKRISTAVGKDLPGAEWEFVLFENDAPNAFALPGGKVGVYTGLFNIAHGDDDLAVVIGHEIAHVTAHHGGERLTRQVAIGAIGAGTAIALNDADSQTRAIAMAAYGAGAVVGVELPFSRLNEREADEIGLVYAARAGYDPRAAIGFWSRMKEASRGKSKPPEWLSTHPSDDTRIKKIEEMMPRMIEIYDASKEKATRAGS
jgi:predicted Zn-dependent protease